MAKDHYVAQTYLKHFGDDSKDGMLNGYKKPDGSAFPCWPKDVCHEWEGDFNPAVVMRPEVLGDYRKIFEPHWSPAISSMLSGKMSANDKFIVSAYMANMMVCTPAWRRVAGDILERQYESTALFRQEMHEKHGVKDERFAKGIEMLKRGRIKAVADPNKVKAIITGQLLTFACITYNLDWILVENDSGEPFITSDNPVAMDYCGPSSPVTRMLPITPWLCLSVTYPMGEAHKVTLEDVSRILRAPSSGSVRRAKVKPAGVRHVNQLIVKCAEEHVFSSRADNGLAELVRKCGKFGLDAEYVEVRKPDEPDAVYRATSICVRERTQI